MASAERVRMISRARAPLRAPALTVARLTIERHLRGGWFLLDLALTAALFAVFLARYPVTVAHFGAVAGVGLGAIGAVATAILARQALGARALPLVARLPDAATYCRGVLLAALALRLPPTLILLALELPDGRLLDPAPWAIIRGLAGILAFTALAVALTLALAPPLGTRRRALALLAWLALAFLDFGAGGAMPGPARIAAALVGLPFLPPLACLAVAGAGLPIWVTVAAPLATAGYTIALGALLAREFGRRDLPPR